MIQLQIHSNSHVDYNNRNASGLYEIIDRKHPSWSQDVEENSPQLLSIPGFFHLISWKKLPSYRTNKSGIFLKTLAVLTHSEKKIPLESISWNILISCHDIYFMNQESLNYLHTEAGKFFSLEKLIQVILKKYEKMPVCAFNKSEQHFFRRGKLPACAGGFDSYKDLVNFNKRQDKKARAGSL